MIPTAPMIDALALSHVPRWSIVVHSPEQYVGDHTFRTLVIFKRLCDEFGLEPTVEDVFAVLYHDLSEARTGDIPSPAKRRLKIESDMVVMSSLDLYTTFRLADLVEAHTFIAKFGIGEHSKRVAMLMYEEIRDFCPGKWWPVISFVIDEITFDTGR